MEAMNTLFQEKHTHTGNSMTVEVSRRTEKKLEFTLQKLDPDLHLSVEFRITCLEARLSRN